jgi:hypothetical protein
MGTYKGTRVHNQEGNLIELGREGEQEEICVSEANEEGEIPQGAKSLHLGGLVPT